MAEGGFPDLENQKKEIDSLLKVSFKKGDTWYLIDTKWFKQWKKYVGYDNWDSGSVGEASANPGPIDNKNLFKENTLVESQTPKLKDHMIDDIDYMLVPEEAWNKLVAWYGLTEGQAPMGRKVITEGYYQKQLKIEIYPVELKLCPNKDLEHPVSRPFSRADTIDDLEKEMRRTFNISENKEVRLWNRYTTKTFEHLNKPEDTLQDAGLYQGQVIVIELKNEDGTWPRQAKSQQFKGIPSQPKTAKASSSAPASSSNQVKSSATGASSNTAGGSGTSSSSSLNPQCLLSRSGDSCGEGRVSKPGLCGLSNLRNTCFMNTAIQCMSNVPPLTKYFLCKNWVEEINEENPFGMGGEIARSYAELIQIMWSGKCSNTEPRNFKRTVDRFAPHFSGNQQHNCQDLMAFLLDGLHEDLNRIQKKPYIEIADTDGRPDQVVADEAWSRYKKRNDSIIMDIFHGLYKSTVQCQECSKICGTFDPFCYLSLPLSVKEKRQIDVFWVPLNPLEKPVQFKLTVPKMGCVADMCNVLTEYVEVKPEYMVATDVYSHRFHKVFSRDESLSHILDRDDIFIYQVRVTSADDPDQLIVPIYLREQRNRSNYQQNASYQLFGLPLLLTVPRKSCSYDQLYSLVLQKLQRFVHMPPETDKWWLEEKTATTSKHNAKGNSSNSAEAMVEEEIDIQDDHSTSDMGMEASNGEDSSNNVTDEKKCSNAINGSDQTSENSEDCVRTDNSKLSRFFKFTLVNSYGNADMDYKLYDDGKPLKLNSRSYVALDWHPVARKRFYDEDASEGVIQHETMKMKPQTKQVIQINDCLELFTTTEKLGEKNPWYGICIKLGHDVAGIIVTLPTLQKVGHSDILLLHYLMCRIFPSISQTPVYRYCPKCEKHQQATKKLDIWSLPDVLIIHLKRFSFNWQEKIDALVKFPTRGLDMRKYVIGDGSGPLLYDLIAVANHNSELGGGHYTAYGKNCEDGKWYYFDDSSVSEATAESVVTKTAYMLVYMKQNPQSHVTK